MVGPPKSFVEESDERIFDEWIPAHWQNSISDSESLVGLAKETQSSFAVLDDYRINKLYQEGLKSRGLKYLKFGTSDESFCHAELVVNANPGASVASYSNCDLGANTSLLLGPAYAVLRDEIKAIGNRVCSLNTPKVILIYFGGGDDRGLIIQCLRSLEASRLRRQRFMIVLGALNPNREEIELFLATSSQLQVELIVNPKNIFLIMSACDAAIMSGGMGSYEVVFMGIPMLLISLADNQALMCRSWQELGAAVYIGKIEDINLSTLSASFDEFVDAYECLRSRLADRSIVDGKGAARAAERIMTLLDAD